MSDVYLYQTIDDGDINIDNGVVGISGGLATSVYLALFGGNKEDQQRKGDPFQWWGNAIEADPDLTYRSETQYILRSLPLVPSSLRKLELAVLRDLDYLITKKVASSIAVSASVPSINKVLISIVILAEGEEEKFDYVQNWGDTP